MHSELLSGHCCCLPLKHLLGLRLFIVLTQIRSSSHMYYIRQVLFAYKWKREKKTHSHNIDNNIDKNNKLSRNARVRGPWIWNYAVVSTQRRPDINCRLHFFFSFLVVSFVLFISKWWFTIIALWLSKCWDFSFNLKTCKTFAPIVSDKKLVCGWLAKCVCVRVFINKIFSKPHLCLF